MTQIPKSRFEAIAQEFEAIDKAYKSTLPQQPEQLQNPANLNEKILVDDVLYPSPAAALFTLQAMAGENVHMRNIIAVIAQIMGHPLPPWQAIRWPDTIKKDWLI